MSDKKKPYDVVVFEKYTDKTTGEEKSKSYQVGVAFELEGGGFSVQLPEGIAITGRCSILPRREKADAP